MESYVNLPNTGQFLLIFTIVWDTLFPFNLLGRSELIFQGVLQNYGQKSLFFLDCSLRKHFLQHWNFCCCLYSISLSRLVAWSKQPGEFRHHSTWWLRAVTQNIYFRHAPWISCQFQPGHEWTSCQCVWRTGFPFLSPHPPLFTLPLSETSAWGWIGYFKTWSLGKKFWLVKKNFPLSKLLKKMVIWGCDPVEAKGVQSNGW